jgi:outer membrane beta-barrel protein
MKLSTASLTLLALVLVSAPLSSSRSAQAAGTGGKKAKTVEAPAPDSQSEEAAEASELEKIKNRYWAQGSETEMGVVQNRLYTKQGKVESWLFGGVISTDPFLSIKTTGLSLGYHLNETSSFHVMGMRHFVDPSSALEVLRLGGKQANTNSPRGMVGAEYKASLLYGKLSLLGAKILYYDMHLGLGGHMTSTETGNVPGPMGSIGQSIYIKSGDYASIAVRFDYRMMAYREEIVEKEITAKLGQVVGARNNFSNTFQLGISFLWGGKAR